MSSYVASIDQGTSSTRFMIVDKTGKVVAAHQQEHKQYFPSPGLVEHDPDEIWRKVKLCVRECMRKAHVKQIEAIGITNQRETTVVWNKTTGKPYHNAIVWNDMRTSPICERLAEKFGRDRFRSKTGLPLAPYFSASKLIYLLENVPGLRQDAEKGLALFGTIDCWIIWKLTRGEVHATDVTNASRTLLMNLHTLAWDDDILTELDIPKAMLPSIVSSSEVIGTVNREPGGGGDQGLGGLDELIGVRIAGVLGDQQAALFGQTCFRVGDVKCTYGTGAFLLMNTGDKCIPSTKGLITTVGYKLGNQPACYALEGSVAYAGLTIQWLRDNLQIISNIPESEQLANSVADNGGVYFVPAFSGLYAPYWREDARGIIAGLTAFNTKAHVCRAALEAAAFQVKEVIDAMEADAAIERIVPESLKVDGGMTRNTLVMQFQADLLNLPLETPVSPETTAVGAAFAAGLAVGYWKSLEELRQTWVQGGSWQPHMDLDTRDKLVGSWMKAINRTFNWIGDAPSTPTSAAASTLSVRTAAAAAPATSITTNEDDSTTTTTVITQTTTTTTTQSQSSGALAGIAELQSPTDTAGTGFGGLSLGGLASAADVSSVSPLPPHLHPHSSPHPSATLVTSDSKEPAPAREKAEPRRPSSSSLTFRFAAASASALAFFGLGIVLSPVVAEAAAQWGAQSLMTPVIALQTFALDLFRSSSRSLRLKI